MNTATQLRSTLTDARRIPVATRHTRRRQRALAHVEHLESRRLFAAIAWDGGPSGNGTDWFTAANWAGDVIPGANDDVTLGLTGSNPLISALSTVSVKSLTSSRNLSWSSTFNLAAPSSFAAATTATQNSGGELGGAGTLSVGGNMVWAGGLLLGGGTIRIENGGTFSKTFDGGSLLRNLDNFGTMQLGGTFGLGNGAVITNQPGKTINVTAGNISHPVGAVGEINNLGTLNFNLTAGSATLLGIRVVNSGVWSVASGTVTMNFAGSSTGEIRTLAGAFLDFATLFTLGTGASLSGAGRVRNTVSSFILTGAVSVSSTNFQSIGGIEGSGDLTIAPGGTMTWLSEQISGTGKLIVSSGGTLNVETGVLSRTLDNSGTINRRPRATDGSEEPFWTFNGGRLNNLNGGLLNVTTRGTIGGLEAGNLGTNLIRNQGLITTAAGIVGSPMQFQVPVENTATGTLRAISGVTTFNGTISSSSAGIIESLPGARLSFASTFTLNTGAVIRGGGLVVNETTNQLVLAGSANLDNITFTTSSPISGLGDLTAGPGVIYNWRQQGIEGAGKLIVSSGATLNINFEGVGLRRLLENFGTVNIQNNNFVVFNGGTLDNKPGATLNFISGIGLNGGVLGNKLINSGLIVGQLGAGSISSDVEFTNTGVLRMTSGTLTLNSTPTNVSGSTLTGGTWQVLGGTLNTTFSVSTNAATIELAGGSWPGAAAIINNNGTLKLSNGVDYSRNFAFVNNGMLDLSAGSILSTQGTNPFTQGTAGTLITRVRGPLLTDFGRVASGGDFTLGGTLTAVFEQNYVPDPVPLLFDTVQTTRSRIGTFAQVTSSGLPGFLVANANYTATKAQLNVELGGAIWTGLGDGTTWTQATNWLGNVLPAASQEVTIDVPTSPTIRIPAGADITIRKLVHTERLEITGSLTITEESTVAGAVETKPAGRLNLLANSTFTTLHIDTAGQLDGPGNITVTTAMDLAGTVTGTGSLTLVAGTVFRASYAIGKNPLIDRTLTIQGGGTIGYATTGFDTATVSFGPAGLLTNSSGTVLNLSGRTQLIGTQPIGSTTVFGQLVNQGELNFSDTGLVSSVSVPLVTSGQVNVLSGEVNIGLGGSGSGSINVTGTLRFDMQQAAANVFTVNGPLSIVGIGAVRIESGTLSLSNQLTLGNTGSIQLSANIAGFGQLRAESNLNITGGQLAGSGVFAVAPGANVVFTSGTVVSRGIDNSGSIILFNTGLVDPAIRLSSTSLINRAQGTIEFTGSASTIAAAGTGSFIRNLGLLRGNSSNIPSAPGVVIEVPVTNTATGRLLVGSNRFELRGGGLLEGAQVQVSPASDLVLASQVNLTSSTILAGPGTVVFSGGVINLPSGAQATGNVVLEVATGELIVNGTINPGRLMVFKDGITTIQANQTLANVTNSGVLRGNGDLSISNSFVWLAGTLAGPGTLTLPATTRVLGDTAGNPPRVISREVRTSGFLEIGAPAIGFAGGKLVINPPGQLQFTTSSTLSNQSGTNGLVNNGLLRCFSQSSATNVTIEVPFTNTSTGTVQVDAKKTILSLTNISGSVTGSALTGGTWKLTRGIIITAPNAFSTNAAIVELGDGTGWATFSGVAQNTGVIRLLARPSKSSRASFSMVAGLTNSGTIELLRHSELRLNGNFVQSSQGVLVIQVEPPRFSFLSGSTGTLNVSGYNAQLGGTLQILSTTAPTGPFSVTLIRSKTQSGTFSNVLLPADNEFGSWRLRLYNTAVTLTLGDAQTKGG